ncbi:unnamed protein product [Caretta caretta]
MDGGISYKDNSTRVVAKKFFNEVVCRYGIHEIIDSDNAGAFVGEIFTTMIQAWGIKQKLHIPHRPQSLGQVERINRTIKEVLQQVLNHTGKDWPDKLPLILAAIHISNRLRTKNQPFQILFGHSMRLMIDPSFLVQGQEESFNITQHDYFQWLKQLQEDKTTLQYRVNQAIEHVNNKIQKPSPTKAALWETGDQVTYLQMGKRELK